MLIWSNDFRRVYARTRAGSRGRKPVVMACGRFLLFAIGLQICMLPGNQILLSDAKARPRMGAGAPGLILQAHFVMITKALKTTIRWRIFMAFCSVQFRSKISRVKIIVGLPRLWSFAPAFGAKLHIKNILLSVPDDVLLDLRIICNARWKYMAEIQAGLYRNISKDAIPLLMTQSVIRGRGTP